MRRNTIIESIVVLYVILFLYTGSSHVPCTCGGIIELLSWKQHVMVNTIFIALAIVGVTLQKQYMLEKRKEWNLISKSAKAV